MTFSFLRTFFAAAAISLLTGHAAGAADISGAGATFPFPIYAKWADAYKKETGNGLNYQSIGSGGGIKQIKAKTVTFGATDMPLEAAELKPPRARSVSDRDRRRRAGRQSRGDQARRTRARRPGARQDFPWRNHHVGRSRDQEAEPESEIAVAGHRCRSPFRRLRHNIYLDQLSLESERRLENEGWRQHGRRMARRPWRQGQ